MFSKFQGPSSPKSERNSKGQVHQNHSKIPKARFTKLGDENSKARFAKFQGLGSPKLRAKFRVLGSPNFEVQVHQNWG